MRRDFRLLILNRFDTQADFASAARIDETRLSRIIRRRTDPRDEELNTFRRILGGDEVDRIFSSAEERTGK